MSSGTIAPSPVFIGWQNGKPLVGGLLTTYAAGTNTKQATFTDAGLTVPNANPIVLDANGSCVMYLLPTAYKMILQTPLGATVWSVDNIIPTGSVQTGIEVKNAGGIPENAVTRLAFPVGATLDKLHEGSASWNIDSNNLPGLYQFEAMLYCVGGGAQGITVGMMNLTDGSPNIPIISINSNSAIPVRVRSANIPFAAGGSAKEYGWKTEVDAGNGFCWGISVLRVG